MESSSPIQALSQTARFARAGNYNDAATRLNQGLLVLQERRAALPREIAYSLQTLMMMLEQRDWVAVADIIDYEFIPLWERLVPGDTLSPKKS
jgi:hypothetical protein